MISEMQEEKSKPRRAYHGRVMSPEVLPHVSIPILIAKLRPFVSILKSRSFRRSDLSVLLKQTANSGSLKYLLSSLLGYGLAVASVVDGERCYTLTERGRHLFILPQTDPRWCQAARDAALEPETFRRFYSEFTPGNPLQRIELELLGFSASEAEFISRTIDGNRPILAPLADEVVEQAI